MAKEATAKKPASATKKQSESTYNPVLPPLEEFLKAGVHFGHNRSRKNPKMDKYIFGERNGVSIIDVIQTMKLLKRALVAVKEASDRGYVLFVGTKGQAASIIENLAEEVGAFYVTSRWPGGLFTNFKVLKNTINKYRRLEESIAVESDEYVVKKEIISAQKDLARMDKIYRGLKFMEKLPKMLIVVDSKVEKNAIKEARRVGIPVVALIDTNCDPSLVDYPVPANDDSIKSIGLLMELFAQAVAAGRMATRLVGIRKQYYAELEAKREESRKRKELEKQAKEEEIQKLKELKSNSSARVSSVQKKASSDKRNENSDISSLNLSTRIVKALNTAGFKTVEDIQSLSRQNLLAIKGIGSKAVDDIMTALGAK